MAHRVSVNERLMRPLTHSLALLALWVMAGLTAWGEISRTSTFEQITQEQGLSNNAVRCLLQDRRGFLWIGTEDGLNRYDGKAFKVYRHRPDQPASLPSNLVSALYETRDGTLWIGLGRVGFCRHDPQTDGFIHYRVAGPAGDAKVFEFYEDRQGVLWVATDGGLGRLSPRRDDFRLHSIGQSSRDHNVVLGIREDPSGQLWLGSNQGLLRFDRATGAVTTAVPSDSYRAAHARGEPSMIGWQVIGIAPDGRLRLVYGQLGVALFDPAQERLLERFDVTGALRDAFPSEPPTPTLKWKALLWEDVTVWIGFENGVMRKIDLQRRACQTFEPSLARPNGFVAQRLMYMLRDRSGVLWFGDGVAGLIKFSETRNRFALYRHVPFDDQSLSNNYIRGIWEDRSGQVWVATQFGGLNRLDRSAGKAVRYRARPTNPRGLRSDAVWAVHEDRQGVLWVGTERGLQILDRAQGVFRTLPALPDPIHVNLVYEDPRGNLWVGTPNGNLYEISPDRRTCRDRAPELGISQQATKGDRRGLIGDVQAIYASRRDGRLWIGLLNGAVCYDPTTGDIQTHFVNSRPEYGEPYVTHFAEGADGTLWMVTKGAGLCRFDPARERFTHITERDGLPHNNCYAMFPDAAGYFWLSSDAGIARFDPARMTFRSYALADGLQGREFNRFSAFQNARGEIFFGGTNGLNAFHPSELTDNALPPPVALTELRVNGQARAAVDGLRLALGPDESGLEAGYAGLDFQVPEDNRYQYWLEGFDRGWRAAGGRREASYTNLPPGRYRFWAMAANHDGVWGKPTLLFEAEIRPPWWRTWPAYLGFALAGGLALYGGVKWRLRQLVAQNRQLEIKVAERTAQITHQNQELERRNLEIERQRQDTLESLTYAQAIQQAMLPTEGLLSAALGEHFVLWRPKDIVSGDFYWLHQSDGQAILVVADCTGHGVPGAFMSLIGNDLLGRIVADQGAREPARILALLHQGIRQSLKQDASELLPDGMDAAVCTIDCTVPRLTFAGARQSLYLVADGALTEIKGDRQALGGSGRERHNRQFTNHALTPPPGAMAYLATDGFADQPDERGKKYGKRRFLDLLTRLAAQPAAQQLTQLEAELAAHSGSEPQRDDITIVGVRWQCASLRNGNPDQRA